MNKKSLYKQFVKPFIIIDVFNYVNGYLNLLMCIHVLLCKLECCLYFFIAVWFIILDIIYVHGHNLCTALGFFCNCTNYKITCSISNILFKNVHYSKSIGQKELSIGT